MVRSASEPGSLRKDVMHSTNKPSPTRTLGAAAGLLCLCAVLSSATNHVHCGRPCDKHRLRLLDPRTGAQHEVRADAGCRNTVFLERAHNESGWVTPLRKSSDGRPARIMFRGGPYGGDYKWAVDREKVNGPFPERGPDEGYLIGARNVEPDNGGGDWTVMQSRCTRRTFLEPMLGRCASRTCT